jgi:hypothetical protein
MILSVIEFLVGLSLAGLTLRDVFSTVIVAGESRGPLRVARRVVFGLLPVWKLMRGRRGGVSTSFAPLALTASFAVWILLLIGSFGLMAHSMRPWFSPQLDGFGEALYLAGNSLATLGVTETDALGPARMIVVGAGFCGLAVMTLAVTYLIEVQGSIALRDAFILKFTTTTGQPPAAVILLERYANLDYGDQLQRLLHESRDWCAGLLQSHASHPSLIYFRSVGTATGWPAALGAIMDLGLILETMVDAPGTRGAAVLLREEGFRLLRDLSALIGLEQQPGGAADADVERLHSRLGAAGYTMRPDFAAAQFAVLREEHASRVRALAAHLGMPEAPLLR